MCAALHADSVIRSKVARWAGELYGKSGGKKYAITEGEFAAIVISIAEKYLPESPSDADIRELCSSLRVEELALARACAAGNELAWQDFMIRYREKLHDTALAITREESQARELAGSIYAELYGTGNREGKRVSKLSYYNGRGSLEGWLRTVLAQRKVNDYRSGRKLISLDEESEQGKQFIALETEGQGEVDPRLNAATDAALGGLSAEDRCILAYYFLDDLTLAKIATIVGVHESTISRRIEKLIKTLRKNIVSNLVRSGMGRRQAEDSLDMDVRDLTVDIRKRLTQESAPAAFSGEKVIRAGEGQD